MKWVSSAAQVRELDRFTIEELGVPGAALMELAAAGVAEAIRTHHWAQAQAGVAVVCGSGNNGGDGYAIARRLHGWGLPVHTVSLKTASTGDAATMRQSANALGIPDTDVLGACGLIVDAVFGTGLSRAIGEPARSLIDEINAHPAPVVAVDLPSGVDTDTGQIHGVAVHAVRTLTFARLKPGLLQDPGRTLAGEVDVVDIGLVAAGSDPQAVAEVPEAWDLSPLWPQREGQAHKGSSGHLLVIAGSEAMAGAAVLSCRAALRAGAGLVSLMTAGGALPRLAALPPEVMVIPVGPHGQITTAPSANLSRFDAIVAGPGLGGGQPLTEALASWLGQLWEIDSRPMLFDADALGSARGSGGGERVITPHPGEAARLLDCRTESVQQDRLGAAVRLATGSRVAVLKGPGTVVAGQGRPSFNPTGGPTLATGGSGDVLTGTIGALLARGVVARDAARLGVWVHGAAADSLRAERSQGWVASDVADRLPAAIEALIPARA